MTWIDGVILFLSAGGIFGSIMSWYYVGRWLQRANGERPFLAITRNLSVAVLILAILQAVIPFLPTNDDTESYINWARVASRLMVVWMLWELFRLGRGLRGRQHP